MRVSHRTARYSTSAASCCALFRRIPQKKTPPQSIVSRSPKRTGRRFSSRTIHESGPEESIAAYKELKLKTEFYRQNNAKDTFNEIDRTDIAAIKSDDSAYVTFTAAHAEIPDVE